MTMDEDKTYLKLAVGLTTDITGFPYLLDFPTEIRHKIYNEYSIIFKSGAMYSTEADMEAAMSAAIKVLLEQRHKDNTDDVERNENL